MSYISLFLFAILGVIIPFKLSNWCKIFILSISLDEYRIFDISITNVLLLIVIFKYIATKKIKIDLKLGLRTALFLLFSIISFFSFLISNSIDALKSFVSLNFLIIITLVLSDLVKREKYRLVIYRSIYMLSILTSITVIAETLLFYIFGFQVRDSVYSLINLSLSFYYSSGLFSSNGLAAFHILPGIIFVFFGTRKSLNIRNWHIIILWAGLILTMTRGGMIVAGICFMVYSKIILNSFAGFKKYIGNIIYYTLIASFLNLIVFISYFNISSVASRIFIINGAITEILNKPLFGNGLSSKVEASQTDLDFIEEGQVRSSVFQDSSLRETHNSLLQIGLETGLSGLSVFLFVFILFIYSHYVHLRFPEGNYEYHKVALILLCMTIISMNMNSYLYLKLFWIIIAFVSFIPSLKRN